MEKEPSGVPLAAATRVWSSAGIVCGSTWPVSRTARSAGLVSLATVLPGSMPST